MASRPTSTVTWGDVVSGARFLASVPPFLRRRLSVEEARATLRDRLAHREADLLAVAQHGIYTDPKSPYRALLENAGCQYGDFEQLVQHEGCEGALRVLMARGVYLAVDEYKGRRPVVRGSMTLHVTPRQLHNRSADQSVAFRTGGSRGQGTAVPVDFASEAEQAVDRCLWYDARGGLSWVHGTWRVPGSSALVAHLGYSLFGARPQRWFTPVDPSATGLHPRYRWSARALHWGSLLAGAPMPNPEYVPMSDLRPIAQWLADVLRKGRTPHLLAYSSMAVRLCEMAMAEHLDIRGAQLTLSGEPITAARLAVIRQAGAEAVPVYGSGETGNVGIGCLAPETPDELHFSHDLHALIQPGPDADKLGLPAQALLMSSLRATSRFVLLNLCMGDLAEVVQRPCGCPLDHLGWATHLRSIRSFEKLTVGGMTFLDTDVIHVLEEVLAPRFGGGPTDYQLVEEETERGQPRVRLFIHPRVGPVDEAAVIQCFLETMGRGSGAERVMALVWGEAGFLQVERSEPRATGLGKILHLHRAGAADAS